MNSKIDAASAEITFMGSRFPRAAVLNPGWTVRGSGGGGVGHEEP
jgi:hypothetical protein